MHLLDCARRRIRPGILPLCRRAYADPYKLHAAPRGLASTPPDPRSQGAIPGAPLMAGAAGSRRLRPCDSTPTAPPPTSTGSTAPRSSSPRTRTRPRTSCRTPTSRSCAGPRELDGDSELHYMRSAMRRRHVDRHRESTRRVAQVELDAAPEVRGAGRRGAVAAGGAGRGPGRHPRAAGDPPRRARRDVRGGADVHGGGRALGVKRGTVMSRVFRAREALVSRSTGRRWRSCVRRRSRGRRRAPEGALRGGGRQRRIYRQVRDEPVRVAAQLAPVLRRSPRPRGPAAG